MYVFLIGYTTDSTDCDDTNDDIYPGAPEILNSLDDNCNLLIDEGLVGVAVYETEDIILSQIQLLKNNLIME
ncbi:MAG: putative metal-binding motif-containing protein [Bacteroidetes bacterium]|nr:putative metal-binding motif-containing protein [Bacteroidota bacterium]